MIVSCLVLLNSAKVNFFCFIISLIFGGITTRTVFCNFSLAACFSLSHSYVTCFFLFLMMTLFTLYILYHFFALSDIFCSLNHEFHLSPISFTFLFVFFFTITCPKKFSNKTYQSVYRADCLFALNVLFIKIHCIDHFLSLNIFVYVGRYWCTCALIFLRFLLSLFILFTYH